MQASNNTNDTPCTSKSFFRGLLVLSKQNWSKFIDKLVILALVGFVAYDMRNPSKLHFEMDQLTFFAASAVVALLASIFSCTWASAKDRGLKEEAKLVALFTALTYVLFSLMAELVVRHRFPTNDLMGFIWAAKAPVWVNITVLPVNLLLACGILAVVLGLASFVLYAAFKLIIKGLLIPSKVKAAARQVCQAGKQDEKKL